MKRALLLSCALGMSGCSWVVSLDGLSGGLADGGGPALKDAAARDAADPRDAGVVDVVVRPVDAGSLSHDAATDAAPIDAKPPLDMRADVVPDAAVDVQPPSPYETVASAQDRPRGLVIASGSLYFVAAGKPALMRTSLSAGALPQTVVSAVTELDNPSDVAVDGARIYWTEYTTGVVWSRALAGGGSSRRETATRARGAHLVLSPAGIWTSDNTDDVDPRGVALDGTYVYSQQSLATGLAADGDRVFWAQAGGIFRGYYDGRGPVTIVSSQDDLQGIATDGADVCWVAKRRFVWCRPVSNDVRRMVVDAGTSAAVYDVAMDARFVYWTEEGTGLVRRGPRPLF